MPRLRKRGGVFHIDMVIGGKRLRSTLGATNKQAALALLRRVETAMAEGPTSAEWTNLRASLPPKTYARAAALVGVKGPEAEPTWSELYEDYKQQMAARVAAGTLSPKTVDSYGVALREFDVFLNERRVAALRDITRDLVEDFKLWRIPRMRRWKHSRGGLKGVAQNAAALHAAFAFGINREKLTKNPVTIGETPGRNPLRGAEPFRGRELIHLKEHAQDDLLMYLLLRWTGLRGSDAVALTWREVDFPNQRIQRRTQKRGTLVTLALRNELATALRVEYLGRNPTPADVVLLNPATGKPLSRARLYERVKALGRRAGVVNAHPHRFRDTLAVDMLLRGNSLYQVARALGDTVATVEKHYTPFVPELQAQARDAINSGKGLEETDVTITSQEEIQIQQVPLNLLVSASKPVSRILYPR